MAVTQDARHIAVATPLGKDVLLLKGVRGEEGVSQLFRFELDLLSEVDHAVDFDAIVGKRLTVTMQTPTGRRHINGVCARFSQGAGEPPFAAYRAEIVPWLWLLTQTADCRIFQNMTVPEIIQKIFTDLGFTDFRLGLTKPYVPREYCVQYRETDFNFVSRLMEQYGIFYYFEHEAGKHTLVMGDGPDTHQPVAPEAVPFQGTTGATVTPDDVVSDFARQQEIRPGKYSLTDYNFETPSVSLKVAVDSVYPGPGGAALEVYDYPGEYQKKDEGEQLVKLRIEEEEAHRSTLTGVSGCRHFVAGYRFRLQGHGRTDFDGAYVLTSIRHAAAEGGYGPGGSERDFSYSNTFTCIPAKVPFRPSRTTPRPVIQGTQTAEVVGPKGEEIYTNKHGQVKVQFHWDREGKKDENSSCWIRVSHPWAGKGWGSVSIPRIGQEVIVDFLEGDPDQPIITGRVYNGERMPPYALPAGGVVSGLKTNTTPGGGGSNEMSMDDTKGKEKITIHAQYDMSTTVEHDDTQAIKNNRAITVDGTHTETIKGNTAITVSEGTFTESIKGVTSITIVTGTYSHDVQTGTATYHVKGAVAETFDAKQETTATQEIVIKSAAAHVHIDGKTELKLSAGPAAFILIRSDGTIQIHGDNVEMIGKKESKMGVSTQNVTCNPQKVEVAGAAITSSAVGVHEVSGALIKIN